MKKTMCTVALATAWMVVANRCSNLASTSTPVIPGRTAITLTNPSNNSTLAAGSAFEFTLPDGMKYGVVGLFLSAIVTNDKGIDASRSNWWLGNRTGLSGYTSGRVLGNTLYRVKADKSDVDASAGYQPQAGTYFWTVWGYDEYGNLLYSSESRTVSLP